MTEDEASKFTIFLGVVFSISLVRTFEIWRRFFLFLCRKIMGPEQPPATDIIMQDLSMREIVPALLAQVLSEERSLEGVLSRIFRDHVLASHIQLPSDATGTWRSRFHRWCHGILTVSQRRLGLKLINAAAGTLVLGMMVSYQLTATHTSLIVGHNTVRSNHPMAGGWFPNVLDEVHMVNTSIFPAVNEFQTGLIFKAVAYADACYKEDARNEECSLFHRPRLDFTERHNLSCPFRDHVCLGGPDNVFDLDTGWIDAKALGINMGTTCQFRARKVCSPLDLEGYVQTWPTNDLDTLYVEYKLGDGWGIVQQGDKTFGEYVRDPLRSIREPPQYFIREVKEDAVLNHSSPRQLIPELRVRGGRVSIYFVRPVGVAYTQPSSDPVFPATLLTDSRMANNDSLYYYPHQRSTAFACADSFTIRHPRHHSLEWQPRYQNLTALEDPRWSSQDEIASLRILNVSHLAPSYFHSRYADMSAHFNAPRRIGSFYSAPVEKEQWKLEARKMFATDLALLQYHTHGIAHGLGHKLPRAVNILDQANINAIGIILFPAPGWKNIKVAAFVGFICACIACFILTWKIKDNVPNKDTLVITHIILWAWKILSKGASKIYSIWEASEKPGFFDSLAKKVDNISRF